MFKWHVLTIGHLSRNKFWGEDEEQAYRTPLCTCTVLQGDDGTNIVIDPSLPTEEMEKALFDGCGLHADDIQYTYSTHYHYDHQVELKTFANAVWCMPRADLSYLNTHFHELSGIWPRLTREQVERLVPAEEHLVPGLTMIPLPGHTEGLNAYLFDAAEGKVICTGDCVMTQEFFQHGESYFFGWNTVQCAQSLRGLRGKADVIIPGHGQAFLTRAYAGD